MSISIGAPVQYAETGGGTIRPGLVYSVDGSGEPSEVAYFDPGNSPNWQLSPSGVTKDTSLATNNSWAPVSFATTETVTSGS